jgi:sodium transport system permease protein
MATLLVTPVKRETLAMGKVISLGIIAIISSASSLLGIVLSMPSAGSMFAREGIDMASLQFGLMEYLSLSAIMVTLVALYVAVICMVSIVSKTIKEANTYMAPIYMIVMISGFTTMFTTGVIESWRYLIPVYGSVMALKKLFAFELTTNMLLYTCGSSLVLAGILIFIIRNLFSNEKVMFSA